MVAQYKKKDFLFYFFKRVIVALMILAYTLYIEYI